MFYFLSIVGLVSLLFIPLTAVSNFPFSETVLSLCHFPLFFLVAISLSKLVNNEIYSLIFCFLIVLLTELFQPIFNRTPSLIDGIIGVLGVTVWFSYQRFGVKSICATLIPFSLIAVMELRPAYYMLVGGPFGDFGENNHLYGWRNVNNISTNLPVYIYLEKFNNDFIEIKKLDNPYSGIAYDHPWVLYNQPESLVFDSYSEGNFNLEVRIKYERGGDDFYSVNVASGSLNHHQVDLKSSKIDRLNVIGLALYYQSEHGPEVTYISDVKFM